MTSKVEGDALERLMAELRPKLHRYCARMSGSVIDGEDIVQDALLKAVRARDRETIVNPEAWLFRIAHTTALDFLRSRGRHDVARAEESDLAGIAGAVDEVADRQIAAAGLRTFMHLPVMQRAAVLLMDVLGYRLTEIADISGTTVPAVKAALHRGRARLRELSAEPEERIFAELPAAERARLEAYVERFNARDFDAVRALLADDVRLELVNRLRMSGRADVGQYLTRYAQTPGWQFVAGAVEGRPAVLVVDPGDPAEAVRYFVLLDWADGAITGIRDFLFAPYVANGAELSR